MVPKAVRIAVLVNPANATTAGATLRDIPEAARALGLQIQVLKASTSREIEATFATLGRERTDALFVAGDAFSYGDIPSAVMANRYRQLVPDRPAFKNFERWFAAIAARPGFKNQVAAVALA